MIRKLVASVFVITVVMVFTAGLYIEAAAQPQERESANHTQVFTLLNYRAVLAGSEEVPPVTSSGSGEAMLALDTSTNTLSWTVSVTGMPQIISAHIHEGAPGANGGVVFTLYDGSGMFDDTHPINGTVMLTAAQVDTLEAGLYYINVHTVGYPGGEIRGQVLTQQRVYMPVILLGEAGSP